MPRIRLVKKVKRENRIMSKQDKADQEEPLTGPMKGDFIPPPGMADADERTDALP